MADNKKLYTKLPAVQQTTAIKNFFESTVEQLFSKSNTESIQGFVGSPRSQDIGLTGEYLTEPTVTKRFYGLSPTVNTINPDSGESENLIFYDELIDILSIYGVDTKNHNKIFAETYSAFMPPVDIDKLLNYSEYYWSSTGPSTIYVSGTASAPIDIDIDVVGKANFTPPGGKPFRNGMVVQFAGDHVIPQQKAYTDYIVEGVGNSIMLLLKKDNFSTRFTSTSETEFDYYSVNFVGEQENGFANTAYSAGTVDNIHVTSPGQGYVAPQILIYDQGLSVDPDLIAEHANVELIAAKDIPDFTVTYKDDFIDDPATKAISLEQIIIKIMNESLGLPWMAYRHPDGAIISQAQRNQDKASGIDVSVWEPFVLPPASYELTAFNAVNTFLNDYRVGVRAFVDVELTSEGGIVVDISQSGENYAGEVKVLAFDELVEIAIDPVTTLANNSGQDQYITDTFWLESSENVKVGQYVTGAFSGVITEVTYADAPAGILPKIVLDRDIEVLQTELETNRVLRFRGQGFSALAIRNDVNVISENSTKLLTTQAKVGVNPNNPKDYFFIGGTRSWDKDVDNDGTGDQPWAGLVTQSRPDYMVQQRGAANRNVWSRVNFWYHKDNFVDAGDQLPNRETRAERPILEFNRNLELYNHATESVGTVIMAATEITLAELQGRPSTETVDSVPVDGATFIFPNEVASVSKYIYTATTDPDTGTLVITRIGDPILNPPLSVDGDSNFIPFTLKAKQGVQILSGQYNIGMEYVFDGTFWNLAQEKLNINQPPLFNLYDDNGVELDDKTVYPNSTFKGNKLFNFADEATENGSIRSTQDDPVLERPLVYKQYKSNSEIVFSNYQHTDRYTYRFITESAPRNITGYQFYKSLDDNTMHSYWRFGETPYRQRIVSTYKLTQFDIDKQRRTFSIGCLPNRDLSINSGYDIQVTVNGEPRLDFTYGNTLPSFIDFDEMNFVPGDFIEISANSDDGVLTQQNSSKFELPVGWGRNPYSKDITSVSEPQFLGHFHDYIENQQGFMGDPLASNNFKDTAHDLQYATDIIHSNSAILLGAMLLDDQPYNLVNALRFSGQEFIKYKNRFKHELTNYCRDFDTDALTNEQILEQVLRQLISFKVGREVFNRTYIVPFGDNTTTETFTLAVDQDTVTLSLLADLDQIENSLLVYKNDTLMCVDRCYEITNFNPITVKINAPHKAGDVITAKLYDENRDSAQCPPTPSTMGLTPLVQPEIISDDTFADPLDVLVGHDGSKTPLYGDRRDKILLDFEFRIYNSAKGEFREKNSLPELSPVHVRQGAFRDTGYSYMEWFTLLRHGFSKWIADNQLDATTNEFYDADDAWTWNYGDNQTPGNWRGIYEFYYDTDQPHTHPWEMLGFTEKPLWWDEQYGTDYSSKNTAMWSDLEEGIIRNGPRANLAQDDYLLNNPFRRPGLSKIIPVDANAHLIAPAYLFTTGTTQLARNWENQDTGNHDPDYEFRTQSFMQLDGVEVSHDTDKVYVQGQALLNHDLPVDQDAMDRFVAIYGEPLKQQDISYAIPRVDLNSPSSMVPTLMPTNQAIAVAVNGMPIYSTDYGRSWNNEGEWYYDHARLEDRTNLNYFKDRTDGLLHYHKIDTYLLNLEDWDKTAHSPVVGWAFDGLPIYGPYGYSDPTDASSAIIRSSSSWILRDGLRTSGPGGAHTGVFIQDYKLDYANEGAPANNFRDGHLDRYNRRYGLTPESPDKPIWHYVITVDEDHEPVFPYHVGGGVADIDHWAGLYCCAASVGGIGEVTVVEAGGQYTTATVTIQGDGQGAVAEAVIVDGKLDSVVVTEPGNNYSYATVTLTGDGVRGKLAVTLSSTGSNFNNAIVNPDATKSRTSTATQDVLLTGDTSKQWKFGDISPVEYVWLKSEAYMYSAAEALLVAKPGKFAKLYSDPIKLYRPTVERNLLLNKDTGTGWDQSNPNHFRVHGEKTADIPFVTNVGYTQFINSWLSFQGLDTTETFSVPMRTLNYKLAHRMNGFVDKDTMTVRTDQYSNAGDATSLIIPKENIDVTMHPSNYKTRNSYSGVIIELTPSGFLVTGYDKTRGYFDVMELDKTGTKVGVEVGGDPIPYTQWEPNVSYKKGTAIQHQGAFYQAPINITASATFEKSVWKRLSKLPQVNSASAELYSKTTGVVNRVNYQTVFKTTQEVYDFIVGLNMANEISGFNFQDYDTEIADVRNWIYAAKQFLFWTTGKWENGNTLELSPMAKSLTFVAPRGFIAEVKRQDREQFNIVDHTGAVIDPKECEINRQDAAITIVPPAGVEIYGIILYTKEIDHALVIDNTTEFNDVIYDPLLNQKHRRLKLKATRTANWSGKLMSEGFIVDGDELLPNLDNLAETMGRYQELGFVPVDKTVYDVTRSQYGYTQREYLRDLDILDEQQFDFYRGMIQNKGTSESLTRIARSSGVVQGNVTVYDEWAIRVGDFGDTENNQSMEIRLEKNDIVAEPQLIQTYLPQDITHSVSAVDVLEARYTYHRTPTLQISAPTQPGGTRATAQVILNSDKKIKEVRVLEPGTGYAPDATSQIKVIAAENLTDSTTTKLRKASADMLEGYIDTSVTSLSFTLTDNVTETTVAISVDTTPDAITMQDILDAITASNVPNITATVIETQYNDGAGELIGYNILLTGSDFTVTGGSVIKVLDGHYETQQRFSAVSSKVTNEYQTGANDVTVEIDGQVITRTTDDPAKPNWIYVPGTDMLATVTQNYPVIDTASPAVDGIYPVIHASVTLPLTGNLNTDNLHLNENAQYEYIEVYINGTRITNTVDSYSNGQISASGTMFTLTANSITFPDIRRLPNNILNEFLNPPSEFDTDVQRQSIYGFTADTKIQVIENSVVEFTSDFKQDIPGSTVGIQVTTKEGLLVRIEPRRTYAITPDLSTDDIISIDIDDNTRFVKKPVSDLGQGLWPTTSDVDHTGLTDKKYNHLRNAGYVRPEDVNYRAFDLASLPDLYTNNMVITPRAGEHIHIAKSENQDWNVYQLESIAASQKFLYRNPDSSVSLLTDYSLFNYLDTNQIGESNTGKYLDYYLSIDNANLSDNVVLWTNENVVNTKNYSIADFEAPRMIEARIASIAPHNLVEISGVEPVRGKIYNGIEIAAVDNDTDVITLRGTNLIGVQPGDLVGLKQNIGTVYKRGAVFTGANGANNNELTLHSGFVESVAILNGGTGYDAIPDVTFGASPQGSVYTAEGKAVVSASIIGFISTGTGSSLASSINKPDVVIKGDGTGATAEYNIINGEVVGFEITDPGAGYTTNNGALPTVTITGAAGATAEVTADNIGDSGEILAITALNFGIGQAELATCTVSITAPIGGRAATAVPILRGTGTAKMLTVGSGYTAQPEIIIDDPNIESIKAELNATITGVNIVTLGAGYTTSNPPTVSFSNANFSTPASATSVVNSGVEELAEALQSDPSVRVTLSGTPINTLQWRLDPPLSGPEQALLDIINSVLDRNYAVQTIDPTGSFTISTDLLNGLAGDVAESIERPAYLVTNYDTTDNNTQYTVLRSSPTEVDILRPNSALSSGLQLLHYNNTRILVPNHQYRIGDVVRVFTNTIRGMYQIKSVKPGSFVISAPFVEGFVEGDVIQDGIEIKTVSPHGITSLYSQQNKRIAVHFAEPLYYNKVYPISQVTTDSIIISGFWPQDRRKHVYYEHKYGLLNGSNPYQSGVVDLASATNTIKVTDDIRLEEDLITYDGNGAIISSALSTVFEGYLIVDTKALPSNTTISTRIDIVRQLRRKALRYPTLSTLDHNKVTMNGSLVTVDSYNSSKAVSSSINRNIALREQFTNSDSGKFSLKFSMLKDPAMAVAQDKSSEEISDYGPYIRDPAVINKLSGGELTANGELTLTEVDEQIVDPEFNKGPIFVGPSKGLRYTDMETGVSYVWSPASESYRALPGQFTENVTGDAAIQSEQPRMRPPEFHQTDSSPSMIIPWEASTTDDIDNIGPTGTVYTSGELVTYATRYYVAVREVTAQYNTEFTLTKDVSGVEIEFWRLVTDAEILETLVQNFLVLKRVPGTGSGSPTAIGGKKAYYNMEETVTHTVASNTIERPRYRLEPNVINSFIVYEAVQNTDDDIYYIKVDSAVAPAQPHDYYGTVNAYSEFNGYPKVKSYYDNEVEITLDGNGKISNLDDPIRVQNTGLVIGIGEVEPAAYIGLQQTTEPFAVQGGNASDAVQNILGLPDITVRSTDEESRADITVDVAGYNSFLMWTAGLTPNEYEPTASGPGNLPGVDGAGTILGFGRGYYELNGAHPDDYPETAGLTYNRPVPRLMYSRRYSVYPGFKNYAYVAYEDPETGTIISEEDYDNAVENNQNTVRGYYISDLVEVTLQPEFEELGDTDDAKTNLRADQVFVACFWTEPFTYVNQLVGFDYAAVDANGDPAPLYADYQGTVTRVKYIRLTELPENAQTRRLIPDTGWGGRVWNNRVSDNIDFTTTNEDEIWDIFNPQTYQGGSEGGGGDPAATTIDVGSVNSAGTPTQGGTAPTVTNDGALVTERDFTDVVPTTEVGPVLNGAILAGLPGPCERIDLPQDSVRPGDISTDCSTVARDRYLDSISDTDFDYANEDETKLNVGFVEKVLAGLEDVRMFFNTGISLGEAGEDFTTGAPYHITVTQSNTPYSEALGNRNITSWWSNAVPILMHTLQNGQGSRNDGTQIYEYGITQFDAFGNKTDGVVTSGLGLNESAVASYVNWVQTNDSVRGIVPGGAMPDEMYDMTGSIYSNDAQSMVQGLGFLINYGVNCVDGKYLTIFVGCESGDIKNKAFKGVIDYYGQYVEPEIDPDIVPDDECEQGESRAYQQGAIVSEWDGDGNNAYFGTHDTDGEFDRKERDNIDNIYFPYARPSECRAYHPDSGEVSNTHDSYNKSALNGKVNRISQRTITTLGRTKIPETRTMEFKGYFRAPTSGLYEFTADADDSIHLWISSAWGGNQRTQGGTLYYGGSSFVLRLGVNDKNELAFDSSTLYQQVPQADGFKLQYLEDQYNIKGGFFTKDGPPDYTKFTSLAVSGGGGQDMVFSDTTDLHGYQNTPFYTRDNSVLRNGWLTTDTNAFSSGIGASRSGPYRKVRVLVALKAGEYYFVRGITGNRKGPGYLDLRYSVINTTSPVSNARLSFSGKFCESDNPPAGTGDGNSDGGGSVPGGRGDLWWLSPDMWWNWNPNTSIPYYGEGIGNEAGQNPYNNGNNNNNNNNNNKNNNNNNDDVSGGGLTFGGGSSDDSGQLSAEFEACCESKGVSSLFGGIAPNDAQVECWYVTYGSFPQGASEAQKQRILDKLNPSYAASGTLKDEYCQTTLSFQKDPATGYLKSYYTGNLVQVFHDGQGGEYTETITNGGDCASLEGIFVGEENGNNNNNNNNNNDDDGDDGDVSGGGLTFGGGSVVYEDTNEQTTTDGPAQEEAVEEVVEEVVVVEEEEPTPQYPARGKLLSQYCQVVTVAGQVYQTGNLVKILADGKGSSYQEVSANISECPVSDLNTNNQGGGNTNNQGGGGPAPNNRPNFNLR